MKKTILTLMIFSAAICNAQQLTTGDLIVKKSINLLGKKVTGISTDSTNASKSNVKLITEKAAKNYTDSVSNFLSANLPITIDTGVININYADSNNNGLLTSSDWIQFKNSTSRWTLSGSNIYNNNAGNVGIGRSSPTKKLDVNGDALINGMIVGKSGTTGYFKNTTIGIDALINSTASSLGNTAIGWQSSKTLTSGLANVSIGSDALRDATTAGGTVAIGQNAMGTWGSGLYNIGIGWNVMSVGVGTGAGNIAIGRSSMTGGAVTGSNNTVVGTSSGGITTGSNNTTIGSLINQTDITASNVLTIGGGGVTWITGLSGDIGIGTTSPTTKLDVNNNKFRLRTANTPSSSTDTGNQGDICWDADYLYVCIATNTWKRSPINIW